MGLKARVFLFIALVVGIGLLLYRDPLVALIESVLGRKNSSHGLFVPLISGYLIWLKRDKIKHCNLSFALWPGLATVAAGLVLFVLPQDGPGGALGFVSFLLTGAGLVILLFGKDLFKEVGFPIFYLATMIPLPEAVFTAVSERMRELTTTGSVGLLQALHFPIYREGYDVYLADLRLFVAHNCSGVRYLISYFSFGLAYAFAFKKTAKSRAAVLLGAILLSIVGGVFRLSSIFVLAHFVSPVMAERQPHMFISWVVFALFLFAALWLDVRLTKNRALKPPLRRAPVQG